MQKGQQLKKNHRDDAREERGEEPIKNKKNTRWVQTTKAPATEQSVGRPSRRVFERLRGWEQRYTGPIAAIDMESEEIFLGKEVVEAALNGWKKYPGWPFSFVRIGYLTVHRRRGGLRKW